MVKQLLMLVYPVQKLRKQIIKEYINKSNYEIFESDNPLAKLSILFMRTFSLTAMYKENQCEI